MRLSEKTGASFTSVLIALVVGAFFGAAGVWWLTEGRYTHGSARPHTPPPVYPESGFPGVERSRPEPPPPPASSPNEDYFSRKLREWNLDPDEVRRELDRAGRILREGSRELGTRLAEETSDVRIIAVIKAKLTLDEELSAWQISVGCQDGHVTLTGTLDTPDQIARAIVLALDTKGVIDVDSSLRLRR
ncbi:hypothetical protein ASA1KI_36460 [Opitutales bacterium ASA1]|uniref:BON domain-containing protein n=1 Tax=Congregicoccus parvus TaxID=3081749 RepID=UPI002B3205F8|nr:hypothetical protein ASA1KI_36460 [Opitutales bacterium ASA1]